MPDTAPHAAASADPNRQTVIVNDPCARALAATLDASLNLRCILHQERGASRLTLPEYLAGLRAVREVEALLEPLRGATHSRAWELSGEPVLEQRREEAQLAMEGAST